MSFTSALLSLFWHNRAAPGEREAAFTEISNRVAIFMNPVSPTMDTSDRRSLLVIYFPPKHVRVCIHL